MIEERTQYRVRCDRVKCRKLASERYFPDKAEVITDAILHGWKVWMAGGALCPECQKEGGSK